MWAPSSAPLDLLTQFPDFARAVAENLAAFPASLLASGETWAEPQCTPLALSTALHPVRSTVGHLSTAPESLWTDLAFNPLPPAAPRGGGPVVSHLLRAVPVGGPGALAGGGLPDAGARGRGRARGDQPAGGGRGGSCRGRGKRPRLPADGSTRGGSFVRTGLDLFALARGPSRLLAGADDRDPVLALTRTCTELQDSEGFC